MISTSLAKQLAGPDLLMKSILVVCLAFSAQLAYATGPYVATVKRVQITDIGDPTTSVWLNLDVTNSPCSGTNGYERFTLANEEQYSMALAAGLSGRIIIIYGTGQCTGDVEGIGSMMLKMD